MNYDNPSPIQNLLTNLKPNQKIAIGLGLIILIAVVIFLPKLFQGHQNSDDTTSGATSYVDEQGYTVTTETHINDQGEEVVTGTREDPYGNVTTIDPNLITTYFPYQVMRQHKEWTSTLRYYLSINQSDKIIYANMEDCDVERDKALILDYINSIPIDLSEYTIKYELTRTDVDCGE